MSEHDGFEGGQPATDAEQRLVRQYRDDWFTRQLGEGWVTGGDGIYYPPGAALPEAPPALDEALRESLPRDDERYDDPFDRDEGSRRGRWRRKHSGSSR